MELANTTLHIASIIIIDDAYAPTSPQNISFLSIRNHFYSSANMPRLTSPLKGKANLQLLMLNIELPEEKAKLWVTPQELRDRLDYRGVLRTLSLDMVQAALTYANKGERILCKRPFNKVMYYAREAHADDNATPSDQ